ncbi:MAG TPA: amino acid adenylation domain-containing protein, partial [Chloroflexi bacterium]|nr:amino acid adenylation domain-containing protein [Chloroflexota bacterium]
MSEIQRVQSIEELSPEQKAFLFEQLKKRKRQDVPDQRSIVPHPRPEGEVVHFPMSFAQQRLWFLDQLAPESPFYNVPLPLRLVGPLDVGALERSLGEIVRRHESLRTTFAVLDGKPAQVIAPDRPVQLDVEDVDGESLEERVARAQQIAQAEAEHPFDLTVGPLMRVRLLRLGEADHVLLLNMHHIVSDGWSMGVLTRELNTLYEAFVQGKPSPLEPLAIQYADYAVWQREWLAGDILDGQVAYWREQLAGAPALLELPTDRPRPSVQRFKGAHLSRPLGPVLSAAVRAVGRRCGATLFMTLLAAFQALLARYTGQQDVVVGTPIAGRQRREVEDLIGFFANTLALRADLSGGPAFEDLVAQVREVTLEAHAHQDVPFERLVEALQPERDMSHTPLFQVMFALQDTAALDVALADLSLSGLAFESEIAKFDLTMSVEDVAEDLIVAIEYNTDLFAPSTIERMLDHFRVLLEGAVADPGRQVSELPLLTDGERRQLVEAWSGVHPDYPRESCVHEIFKAQAARTPDAIALAFPRAGEGTQHLTYRALDERAKQLARHLVALGVGSGDPVGLCMTRSAEMVTAMLAVLKAGGAYVPLDPVNPVERLAFMVADTGARVVLTEEPLLEDASREGLGRVLEDAAHVLCVDGDWDTIARQTNAWPDMPPETSIHADHLAYVMYTSGSTGQPKGIGIPHRGVNRLLLNTDYAQLGPLDVVTQAANTSFDAATFEIWGPLLNGGRLVLVPEGLALEYQRFVTLLQEEAVTALFLTTALFNQFARMAPSAFATLRHVMFGGQAVDPESVRQVLAAGGPERLLHMYGPTESTTYATWYPVETVAADATTVPIGRAVANTSVYVLDEHMAPVPVGVPGELYIGGDGLARGYLGQPAMTAERFVPDPFSTPITSSPVGGTEGGASRRLYRTGDLVKWTPDGQLVFLGRIDLQVKVRGFRIELGEIEAILGQHPDVQHAAVVARPSGTNGRDKQLVAYVVPRGANGKADGALRTYLQDHLPEYMVPSFFVSLDELPLNANGKVDRRALPAPDWETGAEASYIAPHTPLEEMVAGIWCDVLGIERVSVTANFFELGGHSLLATQVVSRVRETFQVELPLRRFFESLSIAALAVEIERMRQVDGVRQVPPLVPVSR